MKPLKKGQGFRLSGIAGTGKSYATINVLIPLLDKLKLKWELTATTNKARANELWVEKGIIGQTIHSFLKWEGGKLKDKSLSMLEDLDYLIVDECSMLPKMFYKFLIQARVKYPSLKIVLIGDYQQLPEVRIMGEFKGSIYNYADTNVVKHLTDYNEIELTKNMRCSEEGKYMFQIYTDLIKGKIKRDSKREDKLLDEFAYKRDGKRSHKYTNTNLCYTNSCKDFLHKIRLQKLKLPKLAPIVSGNGKKIYPKFLKWGLCKNIRLTAIHNSANFYNNQSFILKDVDKNCDGDKYAVLIDRITKEELMLWMEDLYKYFDYGYAMTIHRSQGCSIDEPYTISEWDNMSFAMKYVAMSRCKKKEYITINNRFKIE